LLQTSQKVIAIPGLKLSAADTKDGSTAVSKSTKLIKLPEHLSGRASDMFESSAKTYESDREDEEDSDRERNQEGESDEHEVTLLSRCRYHVIALKDALFRDCLKSPYQSWQFLV